MLELESNLGSVTALTNKLASSLDITNKISEESLNLSEVYNFYKSKKIKLEQLLNIKTHIFLKKTVNIIYILEIQSFNGLIIINGRVTLNVITNYEYVSNPNLDKDVLWYCILLNYNINYIKFIIIIKVFFLVLFKAIFYIL